MLNEAINRSGYSWMKISANTLIILSPSRIRRITKTRYVSFHGAIKFEPMMVLKKIVSFSFADKEYNGKCQLDKIDYKWRCNWETYNSKRNTEHRILNIWN